jgi:hypothetical protein
VFQSLNKWLGSPGTENILKAERLIETRLSARGIQKEFSRNFFRLEPLLTIVHLPVQETFVWIIIEENKNKRLRRKIKRGGQPGTKVDKEIYFLFSVGGHSCNDATDRPLFRFVSPNTFTSHKMSLETFSSGTIRSNHFTKSQRVEITDWTKHPPTFDSPRRYALQNSL